MARKRRSELTEEQRPGQRDRAAERRSKLTEEQRQTQRDRDTALKRANYTPRQLLDPDELALVRAKARDNYTPQERLAPDDLALEREKYAACSPQKRDVARKRERKE